MTVGDSSSAFGWVGGVGGPGDGGGSRGGGL